MGEGPRGLRCHCEEAGDWHKAVRGGRGLQQRCSVPTVDNECPHFIVPNDGAQGRSDGVQTLKMQVPLGRKKFSEKYLCSPPIHETLSRAASSLVITPLHLLSMLVYFCEK